MDNSEDERGTRGKNEAELKERERESAPKMNVEEPALSYELRGETK